MSLTFFLIVLAVLTYSSSALNDYWGHFCGTKNCYDLLGVPSDAEKSDIKKAYRALSLEYHPDKNPSPEAKKIFQEIAQANEVLTNDEKRKKYDYFEEHPDEYWNEYGHYFFMSSAAMTDVRWVVLGILVFISIFQPMIQHQKYNEAKKYLVLAASKGWNLKQGGTKTTMELRRQAEDILAAKKATPSPSVSAGSKKGLDASQKKAKKKLADSEQLEEIIKELVEKVKIEGGYSKPTFWDIPVVQIALLPASLYKMCQYHYRYSYLKIELPDDEKERLAAKAVGGYWEEISDQERNELIDRQIWKKEVFASWEQEKEEELKEKRPGLYKRSKRYLKKELGQSAVYSTSSSKPEGSSSPPSSKEGRKTKSKQEEKKCASQTITETVVATKDDENTALPKITNNTELKVTKNDGEVKHCLQNGEKDASVWTQVQQKSLEEGLKKYPTSIEKNERWKMIAECVDGKSVSECIARYKKIKESITSKKEQDS